MLPTPESRCFKRLVLRRLDTALISCMELCDNITYKIVNSIALREYMHYTVSGVYNYKRVIVSFRKDTQCAVSIPLSAAIWQ